MNQIIRQHRPAFGAAGAPEEVVALISQGGDGGGNENSNHPEYMTTGEAAAYLRRSTSWLLRQSVEYLPGRPNLYRKSALDCWFEKHKHVPKYK